MRDPGPPTLPSSAVRSARVGSSCADVHSHRLSNHSQKAAQTALAEARTHEGRLPEGRLPEGVPGRCGLNVVSGDGGDQGVPGTSLRSGVSAVGRRGRPGAAPQPSGARGRPRLIAAGLLGERDGALWPTQRAKATFAATPTPAVSQRSDRPKASDPRATTLRKPHRQVADRRSHHRDQPLSETCPNRSQERVHPHPHEAPKPPKRRCRTTVE